MTTLFVGSRGRIAPSRRAGRWRLAKQAFTIPASGWTPVSREAEVIACIDVVGLDVTSTGRALGTSATAVRVARHRASSGCGPS